VSTSKVVTQSKEMPAIAEILGGILRFFPNTMVVTLFFVGMMTGRIPWILTAVGGLLMIVITMFAQVLLSWVLGAEMGNYDFTPGEVAAESCSLTPTLLQENYTTLPSLWIASSSFYATFIFMNAFNIYKQAPANNISKDKMAVQQRKGMGLISMVTAALLFFFLLVPRFLTRCESVIGTIIGLALGIGWGFGWWTILNFCGANVFPDIHGVMIGLTPRSLRANPYALVPQPPE
jgi:hypothetical protein